MEMASNETHLCTMCGHIINSLQSITTKIAYCCGITKMMHKDCAKEYYVKRYPKSSTTFSLETWDKKKFKCYVYNAASIVYFVPKNTHYRIKMYHSSSVQSHIAHIGLIYFQHQQKIILVA